MDVSLERILSLIEKKPDGKYVHGAKKKFCDAIGAPPNIINEWERGASRSYRGYLYAVSAKYGVSVAWLRGETDDPHEDPEQNKKPAPTGSELRNTGYEDLTPENQALIDQMIEKLLRSQSGE
jgi:hypothetical protein